MIDLPPLPAGTVEVDARHMHRAGQVAGWELRVPGGGWLAVELFNPGADRPPHMRVRTGPASMPLDEITDPDVGQALAQLLAAGSARLDLLRRPPLPEPEPEPPPVEGQGSLFG